MGMGVVGMIIDSYCGSFAHSLLSTSKSNVVKTITHMLHGAGIVIYLHAWVILDKGKCWDSYSSTMVRIWVINHPQNHHVYASGGKTAPAF